MNAPLARLGSEPDTAEQDMAESDKAEERRREPRYAAVFDATIRSMAGKTASALIIDVSLHGACIRSEAEWLRPGSFIAIGLAEDGMIEAVVRWVREGSAGMEFLHPIPPEREDWHALMDQTAF